MLIYDVAVIGGGPAGIHAALEARKRGLSALLLECGALGGVCLNRGCVPTKILLHAVKELRRIREDDPLFGIRTDNARIDLELLHQRISRTIIRMRAGLENQLNEAGVNLIFEKVLRFSTNVQGIVRIHCAHCDFFSRNIVLAVGGKNRIPSIKGVSAALQNNIAVFPDKAWDFTVLPKRIAVIGSGAAGLEYASVFSGLGAEVSVFETENRLGGNLLLPVTADYLKSEYEKRGIRVFPNTSITEIDSNGMLTVNNKPAFFDRIVLAVGTVPLALSSITDEHIVLSDDKSMRTNHQNVFAAGDFSGGLMTADSAEMEGIIAIRNLCGEQVFAPTCTSIKIYSDPEILIEQYSISKNGTQPVTQKEIIPLSSSKDYMLKHPKDQGFKISVCSSENNLVISNTIGEEVFL